jgi:dephospho-CoA kinase
MMTKWPGKFIIGLTGNIATGKSVVRKMLEHLGAYGIDADALGHRVIAKGAPGFQPVIDTFGKWILAPDGQIDRSKLGRLVFSNPEALSSLEDITHPYIRQAIDILGQRASQKLIVIEAIKLLEGELRNYCDTIWVTDATEEAQTQRLIEKRKLTADEALERIHSQSGQDIKIRVADVVIDNNNSFEDTWKQVASAWKITVPVTVTEQKPNEKSKKAAPKGALTVKRAGPKQAQTIAEFITRHSGGKRRLTRTDIMASFGEKAFLLLNRDETIVGVLGWQVENLVSRVDDFYIDTNIPLASAMKVMTAEVEVASRELQSEAALLFLPPDLARYTEVWTSLEYRARAVKELSIRAWQDAAMESMPPGTVMLFKQLRKDRVLRPV